MVKEMKDRHGKEIVKGGKKNINPSIREIITEIRAAGPMRKEIINQAGKTRNLVLETEIANHHTAPGK